jgi:hypothetical protein
VPDSRIGAGAPRALELVRAIIAAGAPLTVLPTQTRPNEAGAPEPGLNAAIGYGRGGLPDFLSERGSDFDIAIVSRPHNMKAFRGAATASVLGSTVYDAEAVFAVRDALRQDVMGSPMPAAALARAVADEAALADGTRMVLAVNAQNADVFRAA